MLNPSLQKQVREALGTMTQPVTLAVFTTAGAEPHTCELCQDTRQLVEELAWLSDGNVVAKTYDLERDAEAAGRYGVDKAPSVVVLGEGDKDYGIRFFGIPSGYEFASLIADLKMVSSGESGLAPETLDMLARLTGPVRFQVFVTPTCPYCPRAVHLAHQFAFASERVTADMVDASEFYDEAERFRVHSVPLTVINERIRIEGAVPESHVAAELQAMLAEVQTA